MDQNESTYRAIAEAFSQELVTAIREWIDQAGCMEVRRNREQIIATFPMVLPALALRPSDPEHITLTAAIDGGHQLIEAIASLTGVRKKTVRFLRGKNPSQIGKIWIEYPFQLFRVLDAIPDHRRPMNGEEWRLLTAFWLGSLQATSSSRHALNSPGEFGWHLFVGLCTCGYKEAEKTLRQYLRRSGSWAGFADFVRNVGRWCERRANNHDFNDTIARIAREQIALELLTRYPAIKLIEMSARWQQIIIRNQPHSANLVHWPALLPDPVTCNGLTVISLTNSFQLFKESEQLNHCVPTYIPACLLGHSHMLAIRDDSGECLSTVEIELVEDRSGDLSPIVIQHRGVNNSVPDGANASALAAAMHRLLEPGLQKRFRQMAAICSEREIEIADCLLHADSDASVDSIARVLPRLEQVDAWLEQRLIQEELWQHHRNDLIEEAAINVGLSDLLSEDEFQLRNEDTFSIS